MKRKRKTVRSAAKLATLDDFLKDQGKLEEFEAVAIKEVIAWQLGEAMKCHDPLAGDDEQHARDPMAGKVAAHFPQSGAKRAA